MEISRARIREEAGMSTGKKIALGAVLFLAVLLVALIIAVPILVDVDRYRPQVVAIIEEQTGKPAKIGRLTLTLFPTLSIRVDDFMLGNPSGFPEGHLIQARRMYAEVDARALWNRQVIIQSLEVNEPVIRLYSGARGKWNFENPPNPQTPASEPSAFALGTISRVTITDGELTVARLLLSGEPGPNYFEAHSVESELEQVDLNAFTGAASASLPPSSRPTHSFLGTPLAYAQTTEPQPAAQGTFQAQSLRFGEFEVTSVRTQLRLFPKQVYFDDLNFDLYEGQASGKLAFNFAGRNPSYDVEAQMSGVDVARLLDTFPDARGKMTGTMEGNIELSGAITNPAEPLAGMSGAGQMSISDGELPSLELNKNMMTLARFSNLGPASGDPSSFSSISADLNIANQKITTQQLTIVGNGVDVEGSGSVALAGEGMLDYEGVATVAAGDNPVTSLVATLSGASFADGKMTFPFTLSGTLEKPNFKIKSAGGLVQQRGLQNLLGGETGQQSLTQEGQPRSEPQSPADLIKGLTGLFGKQ